MDRDYGSAHIAVELDSDGGSVLVADELTCLATAVSVDWWTETGGSVLVAVELTCLALLRVWRWLLDWIGGQRLG